MNFKQLHAFVKVIQLGSFTRASEVLGSQKSHVSRLVSQLEKSLSVRLIMRSTRKISLTPEGKDFYERAVAILAALDDAKASMLDIGARPQGILKIACGNEFGQLAVMHWITRYLKQYPEVHIEADFSNRLVDLVHEGFDLAIRLGKLNDSQLYATKLGELDYGVFTHAERKEEIKTPEDLVHQPLCVFSGGRHKSHWHFENEDGEKLSLSLQARLMINNSFGVKQALVQGLGYGVLPHLIAQEELQTGALKEVLSDWKITPVSVYAVYPEIKYKTPKVRAFIEMASEMM